MSPRFRFLTLACLLLPVVTGGCRQVIAPRLPPQPPFPPTEFSSVVELNSGLVLRASGEIVSRNPTTVRIQGTVTNPTETEIVARILLDDCEASIAGFWAANSAGRLLQPLDGFVVPEGSTQRINCELNQGIRPIAPGVVFDLPMDDLVVSEVLGADFVPGRHIFTVVYVDQFVYQALAADLFIDD